MTAGDDEQRRLRAAFDAAIGATPQAPDRMQALTRRYADWRRRRRILLSTGAASFAALAVAGAGIAIAVGPGHSTHPPDTTPVISSTTPPSPSSASSSSVSPSPSTPPESASASPTPTPTPPSQLPSVGSSASGLRGVVVDEAGNPLPHIYVNSQHGVTQTDANGRFVAPVSDGHQDGCLLFTSQPLYTNQRGAPPGGDYAWQAWPAPDPPSCPRDITADLRIVMRPGADVFGTVRDPVGAPVAGAVVYSPIPVQFMSAGVYHPHVDAITDSQGRYHFYGFQKGEPAGVTLNLDPQTQIVSGNTSGSVTAGSGTPLDITDYGPGCNTIFPLPSCPNASPPATATTTGATAPATPQASPSPAPS